MLEALKHKAEAKAKDWIILTVMLAFFIVPSFVLGLFPILFLGCRFICPTLSGLRCCIRLSQRSRLPQSRVEPLLRERVQCYPLRHLLHTYANLGKGDAIHCMIFSPLTKLGTPDYGTSLLFRQFSSGTGWFIFGTYLAMPLNTFHPPPLSHA